MKMIFHTALFLALLHSAAYGADAEPRLIWREDSGIPLSEVATPDGFTLSPHQAISPILARMSRAAWANAFFFADTTYYYFGNADKRADFPTTPETTAIKINGNNGEITYPEEKRTEQGVPPYVAQGAPSGER